jgi:protein phosphatase
MSRGKELALTVHHRTDTGQVRNHNEDYLGYRQPEEAETHAEAGWLYAVADGVGGAQAGEVASKLAVQTLLSSYYATFRETPAERLRHAFAEANRAVYERSRQLESVRRMGTTLVALAIRGPEATVANVGDSRAYLIREGEIRQITRDHSMVGHLIDKGIITPEQAETHPRRHVLSRSIGARPEVEADLFHETLRAGDRLLLCSDGLTGHVTDAEILATLREDDPEIGVQRLVDLANQRGGGDNITLLLIRTLRTDEERLPPLRPPPETGDPPPLRPWIGALIAISFICVAALGVGGILLLNPTPTPTSTATPRPPAATPSGTPTATVLATQTATLTPSATPLPTQTATARPTATPSSTRSPSPTSEPSATLTATPSATPSPTSTSEGSPLSMPPP